MAWLWIQFYRGSIVWLVRLVAKAVRYRSRTSGDTEREGGRAWRPRGEVRSRELVYTQIRTLSAAKLGVPTFLILVRRVFCTRCLSAVLITRGRVEGSEIEIQTKRISRLCFVCIYVSYCLSLVHAALSKRMEQCTVPSTSRPWRHGTDGAAPWQPD